MALTNIHWFGYDLSSMAMGPVVTGIFVGGFQANYSRWIKSLYRYFQINSWVYSKSKCARH